MSSEPLIDNNNRNASPSIPPLYNPTVTLEMNADIAHGYHVLLRGNPADPSSGTLSFMALTDGNVVDACLGVLQNTNNKNVARPTKEALIVAAEHSEAVQELAVHTYQRAFQIVMDHHGRVRKTFFLIRCCVEGHMRNMALKRLRDNFALLEEAVSTHTTNGNQ